MIKDKHGNEITSIEKGKGKDFFLHLKGEQYKRKLGRLTSDGVFHIIRNREQHLLHKANSYGFNEYLLQNILDQNTIILIKEKGRKEKLKTTVREILESGKYLFFLSQGFEKQLFLKLDLFDVV